VQPRAFILSYLTRLVNFHLSQQNEGPSAFRTSLVLVQGIGNPEQPFRLHYKTQAMKWNLMNDQRLVGAVDFGWIGYSSHVSHSKSFEVIIQVKLSCGFQYSELNVPSLYLILLRSKLRTLYSIELTVFALPFLEAEELGSDRT
jgi:hypothetical protein